MKAHLSFSEIVFNFDKSKRLEILVRLKMSLRRSQQSFLLWLQNYKKLWIQRPFWNKLLIQDVKNQLYSGCCLMGSQMMLSIR